MLFCRSGRLAPGFLSDKIKENDLGGSKMDKAPLTFRMAERKDAPLILQFIRELARYEKLEQEVVATESLLEEWIFDKGKSRGLVRAGRWKRSGLCPVFPQFFHLPGPRRALSGRFVCHAGIPGPGLWERDLAQVGPNRLGEGLRPLGMVVPGLEPAQHRFLFVPGGGAHGGVDRVSGDGPSLGAPGGRKLKEGNEKAGHFARPCS